MHSLRPKIETVHGRYTMTEGHLMLVLGKEYAEPKDRQHASQASPHRSANITNLRKYFDTYNSMEYKSKIADGKSEFKRELVIDERYIERLADVMDSERTEWEKTGFYPIYHGTNDENGHAFRIASSLQNHLTLSQTDRLTRLHYTDLYFRDLTNMIDDAARNGDSHYDNGNRDRRIFGNFVLTAGRATSRSTSSSVEYWGNNHSVADPNVSKRFEEGTALLGMDLSYAPYESLFQQFIADTGTPYGNAMLLQLFIKPDALTEYGATDYMDEKVALTAYQNAQAEYERVAQAGKEDFEPKTADGKIDSTRTEETRKKTGLFGEVRLSLHPSLADDPSQLKMHGLDFFPLTPDKKKRFEKELSKTTAANLGYWFSQRTALIPGSLMEAPAARDLYKMVFKGVTGNTLEDVPNTHSLLHLARFGHIEALKTLVETCPDLVQSIDPVTLCNAALSSGSYTTTKYVVTEIINKDLNNILTLENVLTKLEMEVDRELKSSFKYILKHYDFQDVSDKVKQKIARTILKTGDDYAVKLVNRSIWSYTEEDIKEAMASMGYDLEKWGACVKAATKRNLVTLTKFAALFLSFLKENPTKTWMQNHILSFFKNGLGFQTVNPGTGNPFLFELPYLQNIQESDFELPNNFLSIRNTNGLNVLDHALIEFKKGKSISCGFFNYLDKRLKQTNSSLKERINSRFYTFFKHKLEPTYNGSVYNGWLNQGSPFFGEAAQAWVVDIEAALQTNQYSIVKGVLENSPSSDLLTYYEDHIPEKILRKRSTKEQTWYSNLKRIVDSKEKAWRIIKKMPLSVSYFYPTPPFSVAKKYSNIIAETPRVKTRGISRYKLRLPYVLHNVSYSPKT